MLRHVVLLGFTRAKSEDQIDEILEGFIDLGGRLPGVHKVTVGRNVSPEGLDRGFRHGFIMDFDSEQARDDYLAHPDHVAFAEQTVIPALENGRESIVVFDYNI